MQIDVLSMFMWLWGNIVNFFGFLKNTHETSLQKITFYCCHLTKYYVMLRSFTHLKVTTASTSTKIKKILQYHTVTMRLPVLHQCTCSTNVQTWNKNAKIGLEMLRRIGRHDTDYNSEALKTQYWYRYSYKSVAPIKRYHITSANRN